uniref:Cysteine/serine-rich nuclear protein N-terminal domain-containing protein n=1 Tax=Caenorhabditis japonica TaxID=281687 RepID=A0A8R1E1B7_CAEJA
MTSPSIFQKSCSTPSLPTAPLLRQSSSSSLRFKVSPSTFIRPLTVSPVVAAEPTTLAAPVPEIAAPETETKTSEPSTSTSTSSTTNTTSIDEKMMKKSALKKKESHPVAHEIAGPRRRNVKYDGLKVYYFDRRQGESTVPSEGEVSLAMQDNHHTHRYFPLSTGKRPILDLSLYDDEDLSDGEVIHPDSDGEHDYEEFSSAKFISAVNQKFRIKLLKKSGVKVEKNQDSIDALRKMRVECGCSCENGVCLPETCQCAIDGIQCQVDGGEYPTVPCACFAETCTNPNGRIFYDPDAVQDHRTRTIMNWRAAQKSGVVGSPVVKKFADSDDEDDGGKPKSWLLKKAIPIKLEASPTKYPVTPVYTRRSRTSLSDIRESNSEATSIVPSTTLSERMQHLENEVCVEEDEDVEKDDPTADLTEVYVAPEPSAENELLDAAMSPVQATLVV